MHLFTLPKWAALILSVIFGPFITAIVISILLRNSGYNINGVLAGIVICLFCKEVKKVWEKYKNG